MIADRTIIKDGREPVSIILNYDNETTICRIFKIFCSEYHFIRISSLKNKKYLDSPSKVCSYKLSNKCSKIESKNEVICSNCREFNTNATRISKPCFNKYIRPLITHNCDYIMGQSYKDDYYFIIRENRQGKYLDNSNYHIIKINKCDSILDIEQYEYNRRKYTSRLLMFAQCELVPDIIVLIAVMVLKN